MALSAAWMSAWSVAGVRAGLQGNGTKTLWLSEPETPGRGRGRSRHYGAPARRAEVMSSLGPGEAVGRGRGYESDCEGGTAAQFERVET
jgi:hypothetical protein